MTLIVHGATRKVDFSDDAVGQAPKGFEFGHTAKVGAPGKWVVQAEGSNKYLAQVDPDNTRSRFPVAVVSDVTAADVDLSARFKPVSGRVDQAAGLVWRFQNEDNYYIVRANALENNVVLYKVEKGKRTDLPVKGEGRTYGKKAEVPVRTMEYPASGRGRAALRSVLQRQQAVRGRGHHVHAARQGRPLDQGGLRHAVRRRDDCDEISAMAPRTRLIAIQMCAVLAAVSIGRLPILGIPAGCHAAGHGVRLHRSGLLRAGIAGVRKTVRRDSQRRLRYRRNEVHRPREPVAGGKGEAAGRRVLVQRAGPHAGAEIARCSCRVQVPERAGDSSRCWSTRKATGRASQRESA